MKKLITILSLMAVLLAGCGSSEPPVRIGSKNFGESRILAHMMAELARSNGYEDASVTEYETTQAIQEGLKRGDIDVYPEYNGTALVMLGQNPLTDGDAAMTRVRELYEPLGFTWLSRMGFANNYGLAMRPEEADELGVASISDLIKLAGSLTIGVEDDFTRRPLDGIEQMNQHYGLEFGSRDVVPISERLDLYDRIVDGTIDVVEVFTTDAQIAAYGLRVLEDDRQFFPVYEAAMLARNDSLTRNEGLRSALEQLADRIDSETMQTLNTGVDIEGRDPLDVARMALSDLGLIDGSEIEREDPLYVSAATGLTTGAQANIALRAVREAFRGRSVEVISNDQPLSEVAEQRARLALASAVDLFQMSGTTATVDPRFEAVAAIGQIEVHIVTAADGPDNLEAVTSLLTGPDGAGSARAARMIIDGLGLSAELQFGEVDTVESLVQALNEGTAQAALFLLPEDDADIANAIESEGLKLLPINGWSDGANLVRYPFLRQARIAPGTYAGQSQAVDTLSAQLVLAGPAARTDQVVGDQGPNSISTSQLPISGKSVLALNDALPGEIMVDPILPQAAALLPVLPEPPAPMNPAPDISLLSFALFGLFIWLIWLYIRPEYN